MRNQNGSALIITVLIVTILVALVVEFAYEVYIDTSSLSNWTNAQKASLIAKSGQTLSARYITELSQSTYTNQPEVALPVEKYFGANTRLTIKIEDENAKFNINSIIQPNGKEDSDALESLKKLFEYLNINTNLALVIADWIDTDSEPRFYGSEDNAKNMFLSTVDELKLIKGIDKNVFDRITPYITVSDKWPWKINMNTAKLPVLVSFKNMTETLAKRIIDYRDTAPFEKNADIVKVSGMEQIGQRLQSKIDIKCSNLRITSKATVNEITRTIESVVDTGMKVHFWREE